MTGHRSVGSAQRQPDVVEADVGDHWGVAAGGGLSPCGWCSEPLVDAGGIAESCPVRCGGANRPAPAPSARPHAAAARGPGPAARRGVGGSSRSSGTTTATTRWPHSGSGRPTTATSRTRWSVRSTASTGSGQTFSPPVMIRSSARPCTRQQAGCRGRRARGRRCGTSRPARTGSVPSR